MGSSRLPGKVLMKVGGRNVLEHLAVRCGDESWGPMVVATTCNSIDDTLAREAARLGFLVARGSEWDLLDRYRVASQEFPSDYVVRLTADNPLVDASLVGRTLGRLLDGICDIASTGIDRNYPYGYSCEAFATALLEKAVREAVAAEDREHVTPWMYRSAQRCPAVRGAEDLVHLRWTLDTREDLEYLDKLFKECGDDVGFDEAVSWSLCHPHPYR